MARSKTGEVRAGSGAGATRGRAAYYEDYAKPVIVNWPYMLVAAAAVFVVGHFVNRGAGRRLGGNFKNRPPTNESGKTSGSSSNSRGDGTVGRQDKQPMSLAELRALRVEAAEARLQHGATTSSGPGAAKLTPLGSILLLARKVDKLEEETSQFLVQVKDSDILDAKEEKVREADLKDHARLLELLTQVQLEIDAVQSDESVRPHRKTQTNRVQKLILALEGIEKESR